MANYLYNGVELPDINSVWDKTEFPYAVIFGNASDAKLVVYSVMPYASTTAGVNGVYYGTYQTGVCDNFKYKNSEDDTWVDDPNAASSYDPDHYLYGTWYRQSLGSVLWANHDVYNEAGTLYLAASDPIPVDPIDPTAMLLGWLTGRKVAGMRQRKPVAYLYNGVQLPALPEWDKETYPYAVIAYIYSASEYWFVPTATAYTTQDSGFMSGVRGDEGYLYDADTGSWIEAKMSLYAVPFVKWANYAVCDNFGNVYLSASDPIPVYA